MPGFGLCMCHPRKLKPDFAIEQEFLKTPPVGAVGGARLLDKVVAQTSKPATRPNLRPRPQLPRPADLEVGDTAGLETCATSRFAVEIKFLQGMKEFMVVADYSPIWLPAGRPNGNSIHCCAATADQCCAAGLCDNSSAASERDARVGRDNGWPSPLSAATNR